MKIYMKILVSSFMISVLLCLVPFESTCEQLQRDVLRLHILANSDSQTDQQLKLQVRDEVLSQISPLYDDINSKQEVIGITYDNLKLIENIATEVIRSSGYDYSVNAEICSEYFDTRYYDDFTMPAGVYDTLVITLGKGEGRNWWCVMYPTLCVGASTKQSMQENLSEDEYTLITSDDLEFRFKIVEYFKKISSLFH